MKFFKQLLALSFLAITTSVIAQQTYSTPGTYQWEVPACVTSITVKVWGGGGGGGGVASYMTNNNFSGSYKEACSAGGGGGGGGFVSRTYAVTPGDIYTVVVGNGGAGGAGTGSGATGANLNNGLGGENSSFAGPATLVPGTLTAFGGAFGGGARTNHNDISISHLGYDGVAGAGATGGINGSASFAGGNGAKGKHDASCNDQSGGGGGGAGTGGIGGNATTLVCYGSQNGGAGGSTGGGKGADGIKGNICSGCNNKTNGRVGNIAGGGGSGGLIHLNDWFGVWSYANGGKGGDGQVIIEYSTPSTPAQPSAITGNTVIPCGGGSNNYSVTNVPGVTYTWVYSGTGTISSGQGTNAITLNATTGGTLTVTPSTACGNGTSRSITLSMQSPPAQPSTITGNTVIPCGGGSNNYSVTNVPGVTYTWVYSGTGIISSGQGTNAITLNATTGGTLTVTPSTACGNGTPRSINLTNGTVAVTLTTTQPTCAGGGNNGSVAFNITSGTAPFVVTIDTGGTPFVLNLPFNPGQQTIPNLGGGSVRVHIKDANNCEDDKTVTLNTPDCCTFTYSVSATAPSCGLNNGSITVTPSPNGNYTYNWSHNLPSQASQSNLAGSTYTVTIIDNSTPNCSKDTSITLIKSSGVAIAILSTTDPTCAGNDGSVSYSFSGGTAPYQITINDGGTPTVLNFASNPGAQIISNLSGANSISVHVKDANSCENTATAILTAPNCCTFTYSASVTAPTCGNSNGAITIAPSPAGNYTYNWDNNLPSQANQSNLAAGTYTVTIVDNDVPNCSKDTSITLNNSNGVQVAISNVTNPTCAGGDGSFVIAITDGTAPFVVTIDTGGTPFVLNLPFNPGAQTIPNLTAVNVRVHVKDANDCESTAAATLTAPNCCTFTYSASVTAPTCGNSNGAITIVPSPAGNYTYNWDNNLPSQANQSNLAAGTYTVTIVDNDVPNCSKDTSITLNNSNGVQVAISNVTNPTCAGGDGSFVIAITDGTAPFVVTIDTGGTPFVLNLPFNPGAQTISNLTAVNVRVHIKDANDCESTATATLTAPNCCTFTYSASVTAPTCGNSNGAITIAPSPAGNYTYNWDNNLPSQANQSNLAAGTYAVTIVDSNVPNCSKDTSITLNNSNGVQVAISNATNPTCAGGDGSFAIAITDGTAPFVVTIDTGGTPFVLNLPFNPGAQTISNLTAVNVRVHVKDANDCESTATATLTAPNCCTFTYSASVTAPTCGNSNGAITIVPSPAGNYTYNWDNNLPSQANQSNLAAGTYAVTIVDSNVPNCSKDTSITLNNSNGVQVAISNATNPTCAGGDGSFAIAITDGTAPFVVTIDTGGTPFVLNLPFNPGAQTISNLTAVNVRVHVKDANDCESTATATLTAPNCCTLVTSTTIIDASCGKENGSITVDIDTVGIAPYSYSIDGINFQPSNEFANLGAGQYTIITRDANNCSYVNNASVSGTSAPVVNLGNNINTCKSDSAVLLNVSENYSSYVWSTGDSLSVISVYKSGTYSVTVVDSDGCTAMSSVEVTIHELPVIELQDSVIAHQGEEVVLLPTITPAPNSQGVFAWEPSSAVSCATCLEATVTAGKEPSQIYSFSYTDGNGCSAWDSIAVISLRDTVIFPTVFSPNGDEKNDRFGPIGEGIKEIELSVYNRWGEKIFKSNDVNDTWDGTFNNVSQPIGTYLFTAKIVFVNDEIRVKKGSFVLIR